MHFRWIGLGLWCAAAGWGADWPQWGGGDTRRMVSAETNLPSDFAPGEKNADGTRLDMTTTRNVKWAVKLGSQTCGTPVIADGKVFIGTNNGAPRDPRLPGDRSVLLCFEEATGKFLWQLATSKLRYASNFNGDLPDLGTCSTPTVKDHRVYLTTMRCEAVCLDADGLANGNDGPFQEEGDYLAQATILKTGAPPAGQYPDNFRNAPKPPPLTLQPTDADILWQYDFMKELDVWPQDATDCSPVVDGQYVYIGTSNGVDKGHKKLPAPLAPTLVVLDRLTGQLVATDDAQIGTRTFHGNWSSPSLVTVNGRKLLLLGGGDGICYAFDAEPAPAAGGPGRRLVTVWRCDGNPPEYRERDGRKLPYNQHAEGPSEIIATPAFDRNRVYVTIGQDTRHGPGPGALTCIDATQTGDISRSGVLWRYTAINRSFSTPSISQGLVFVADGRGTIHCLDADTGACYWTHASTGGNTMASTLVADGKVYFGNANGKLTILAASKEKKLINEIRVGSAIHATPVAAHGVLYIATQHWLYALQNLSR
ncbi:MAG: PQQ-binding-like beta-propeller repeat protein [Kiritimatiellaeota bacterium]|nr:PQQ-binding-like beta-propeller repeat protein [Kiritimatiellota bacterium]